MDDELARKIASIGVNPNSYCSYNPLVVGNPSRIMISSLGCESVEGAFVLVPGVLARHNYWNKTPDGKSYFDISALQFGGLLHLLASNKPIPKNIYYEYFEEAREYLMRNNKMEEFRNELIYFLGKDLKIDSWKTFEIDGEYSKRFYCLDEDADTYSMESKIFN